MYDVTSNIQGKITEMRKVPLKNTFRPFKRLIRDLSTGGVIRQHRQINMQGQFMKRTTKGLKKSSSKTMKSAFDDQESYELTELGKQFVHYTMDELAPRINQ